MTTDLKTAVDTIIAAIKKDESYFYAWQSNIAMAFMDQYLGSIPFGVIPTREKIHEIANQSAKNFLNQLIKNEQQTNHSTGNND